MKRVLAFLVALAFSAGAAAQAYKWVDKDGKVRYGDTPPPGVKATPLKTPSGPTPPPAASAAGKDKPLTPEQAFQKRQDERKQAEEKAEKERTTTAQNRQNCEAAQANLRNLQTGARVSTVNAAGERVYMEDEQRERAIQQAQSSVNEWCK